MHKSRGKPRRGKCSSEENNRLPTIVIGSMCEKLVGIFSHETACSEVLFESVMNEIDLIGARRTQ